MSGPLRDEDIRAMLEARAARAHPASAREASTRVTARPLAVPRRISDRGVGRLRQLVPAAIAVVAVMIGGLVVIDRLPARMDSGTTPSARETGSDDASLRATLAATLDAVRLEAFLLDLRSGDLDGDLVIAKGRLEMLPTRCLSAADPPGCFRLRFQGRDDPEIVRDTTMGTTRAAELVALEPSAHPLVFRVDSSHRLVLLGAMTAEPADAFTPQDLADDRVTLGRDALAAVRGVLVGKGPAEPCPSPRPLYGCPLPWAWLTPERPGAGDTPPYAGGVAVTTRGAGDLVGPSPDARSATFIVQAIRQFGGQYAPWNIIGQVDDPSTVQVNVTPP